MITLRQTAQQALEALAVATNCLDGYYIPRGKTTLPEIEDAITALKAALAEPCPCGDRPAAQCPGEWEPGCDLGNNPKYAKRVEMTPKELAASIKRGEKWKVAEPVQEPEALKDPAEYDDFAAAIRHNERITTRRYDSVGTVALETVYETIIHWDEGGGKRSRRELARRIAALYTAPPQRKPLTDEEIRDLWSWAMTAEAERTATTQQHAFARAIERAHGIT